MRTKRGMQQFRLKGGIRWEAERVFEVGEVLVIEDVKCNWGNGAAGENFFE